MKGAWRAFLEGQGLSPSAGLPIPLNYYDCVYAHTHTHSSFTMQTRSGFCLLQLIKVRGGLQKVVTDSRDPPESHSNPR